MRILILFSLFISSYASAQLAEGYRIQDPQKKYLQNFLRPELVVDHVNSRGYEVYGPKGLGEYLNKIKISYEVDKVKSDKGRADHPTPEDFEKDLKAAIQNCGAIATMTSIGKSTKGRDLWFVKISDNVQTDEVEPEFKYISSMHGDEITGRDLMLKLIEDICANYGSDPRITELVNNTEIFIMPSMNPDGTASRQRWNAKGIDLNRDFPDFSVPGNDQNTPTGRAIETQSIMKFQTSRQFALSANFHGGAEVVNYPWDTIPDKFPLHDLIYGFSLDYAKLAPYIYASTEFQNGVTNGYAWYEVDGGMQDWSYHWHNDLQITVELSEIKWAPFNKMNYYFSENREALLGYIEAVHQGVGFTLNSSGLKGTVHVTELMNNTKLGQFEFNNSEFFKVLPQGRYNFEIKTVEAIPQVKNVIVDVLPDQKPNLTKYIAVE